MKAWCDCCGKYIDSIGVFSRLETMEIKGTVFKVSQTYGICPVCGNEVMPVAVVDQNIHKAHNAYRRAIKSITTEEIQSILDKYSIGAQPLSNLLGWGANTISRQLKHTIPDSEHAKRLKSLQDPQNMLKLLNDRRECLTPAAYNKAMAAVKKLLAPNLSPVLSGLSGFAQGYISTLAPLKSLFVASKKHGIGTGELQCDGSVKNTGMNYEFAFAGRKS